MLKLDDEWMKHITSHILLKMILSNVKKGKNVIKIHEIRRRVQTFDCYFTCENVLILNMCTLWFTGSHIKPSQGGVRMLYRYFSLQIVATGVCKMGQPAWYCNQMLWRYFTINCVWYDWDVEAFRNHIKSVTKPNLWSDHLGWVAVVSKYHSRVIEEDLGRKNIHRMIYL